MLEKDKKKSAYQKWYARPENKQRVIEAVRERKKKKRLELRQWLDTLKATQKCLDCGFSIPAALQYHHIDPSTKEFSIGDALRLEKSKSLIEQEISKCIVLCANCHLIRHANLLQ